MLTALAARRIAIAAQGFAAAGHGDTPPSTARMLAMIRRLGLLQLDSVNVFSRAHYLPLFARLGPYDRAALDRLAGHTGGRINRRLIEYWAHEAALIPIELQPLMRWRMADTGRAWGSIRRIVTEQPDLITDTLELVRDEGPVRSRDTGFARRSPVAGQMWNWHDGKVALEYLFYTGQIGAARRIHFERRYDLIERIVPADILAAPVPSRAEAQLELVRIAAGALGIATAPDIADYWRMSVADTRVAIDVLIAGGELGVETVRGWSEPGLLWHAARRPRAFHGRALLSPFDSLVFCRPRTERVFDFRYRIEIYTPAERRVHGYYVLPFLLGDELVARVDLKSDRSAGRLRVLGAFAERGVDRSRVAHELAAELTQCADWLGLSQGVEVSGNGDLAAELRTAAD